MDKKAKIVYKKMMQDALPVLKHFCSLKKTINETYYENGNFSISDDSLSNLISFSEDGTSKLDSFMKTFSEASQSFKESLSANGKGKLKEIEKLMREAEKTSRVLKYRTQEVGGMSKNFSLSAQDGKSTVVNFSEGDGVFKGVAYALAEALKKAADFIENSATMIADIARGEAGAEAETQESSLNDNLEDVTPVESENIPADDIEVETPSVPQEEQAEATEATETTTEVKEVEQQPGETQEVDVVEEQTEEPVFPAEGQEEYEQLAPPMVNGQPVQFSLNRDDVEKEFKNFSGTSKVNENEVRILKNSIEYGKCLLCSKKRPGSKEIADYINFASRSLGGIAREFLLSKIKQFATAINKEKVTMEKQRKVMFSRLLNKGRMMLLSKKVTQGAFDKYMEEVEVCLPEAQDKQELYVRLEAFQKANAKAEKMDTWTKEEGTLLSKKSPKLKADIAPSKINDAMQKRSFARKTAEKIYDSASEMIEKGYKPARVVAHFAKKHGMDKKTTVAFARALSEEFGIDKREFSGWGSLLGAAAGAGAGAWGMSKLGSYFDGGHLIGPTADKIVGGAVGGLIGSTVGDSLTDDEKDFAEKEEKVGERGGEVKTVNTCDFSRVIERCTKLVKDFGLSAKTTKKILSKKFPNVSEEDLDGILDFVCNEKGCKADFAEEKGTAATVLDKAKDGKWMSPDEAREAVIEDVVMMKEAGMKNAQFAEDDDAPIEETEEPLEETVEEVAEEPVEEVVTEEPAMPVEPAPVVEDEDPSFDAVATAELDIPVEVTVKDNDIDARLDVADAALDNVDPELAMFARNMIKKARNRKCFSEADVQEKSEIAASIETIIEGLTKIKDTIAGEAPVTDEDTDVADVDAPENDEMPVVEETPEAVEDIDIYSPSDDMFVEEETQVANFSVSNDKSSWTYGEIVWGRR